MQLKIALRMLTRRPGLTAGRILTVTIVVAAVSAVFTVASVSFLRPLPFPDAHRLVRVYMQPPGTTDRAAANPLNPFEFERFRERVRTFERFEGIWQSERALSGDGEPEAVPAGRVSAGFFKILGGEPFLGRVFTDDEAALDARVAVLGYGLWRRRYGGDPAVVGRTILVDREPHTILGVMPAGFEPAFQTSDFWTPLNTRNAMGRTTLSSVITVGLLRPGVTIAQANVDLAAPLASLREEEPAMVKGWSAGVADLQDWQYGSRRPAILMLLAAVAALALIAIANLANLTLADVMFRRSDFAVRAALGASRADLAATEFAQSAILAAVGGAAGLLGAAWLVPQMLALDPLGGFLAQQARVDWRVALCAFAIAAIVMMAAVAAPVLRLAGPVLAANVTAGSRRAIGGRSANRARVILVTAQTALALVLLSSGALIVDTLQRSAQIPPGYDPSNVVTAQLRLSANLFPTDLDRATFVDRMLQRVRAAPGVVSAGTTLNTFTDISFSTMVQIEDRPSPDGQPYAVHYRRVSPGYFETMRIKPLQGRVFDRHDWVDTPLVVIVSRSFAAHFWPGVDPIGRRIKRGATASAWSIIVGVVDDVRDVALDQPPGDTIYSAYYQASNAAAPVALVVRTAGDPRGTIGAIKRAVWEVDAKQPLANVITLEQFLSTSLGAQRFRALLISACGMIGLLLATIGTYGVTARSVVERTREVGIRMALGGRAVDVWWTIAWGSLRAVVAGAVLGLAGAMAAGAALAKLLPETSGASWFAGAAAGAALLAVGAIATMIAASRVISIEPLRALRTD